MKNERLQKFCLAFCLIASLFVSSISAACSCAHHRETAENTSPLSCHDHSMQKEMTQQNHDFGLRKTIEPAICETGCICIETSPKVIAKTETVRVEKQLEAFSLDAPVEIAFVPQTVLIETVFSKPLYLSDSFYNLPPGRAPPVL